MELTEKNKKHIDSLSYGQLLSQWRHSPSGNPWFHGDTGKYWSDRMAKLRDEDNSRHVSASKSIGW